MGYEELTSLSLSYPPAAREDLMDLANGYQRRSEGGILELAAMAADLSTHDIINLDLEPEPDPQVLEALERLYHPNPIPEDLGERSGESLGGLVSAVKGIYFEVLVRDRLNAGETVGELRLEPGQMARLAVKSNEPGWDLEIIDRNGEVEQLQLKAHEAMGGICKALQEHDFRVVVAEHIDSTPDEIIGTDVSLKDLTEHTKEQLSEFAEGTVENAVDVAAEAVETAWDIIPLGSGLLIGVTEGAAIPDGPGNSAGIDKERWAPGCPVHRLSRIGSRPQRYRIRLGSNAGRDGATSSRNANYRTS